MKKIKLTADSTFLAFGSDQCSYLQQKRMAPLVYLIYLLNIYVKGK